VYVDKTGNLPAVPYHLVIRTANPMPVAKFYRALGVDIGTGSLADGTRCYLGRSVGLELTVVPAQQTPPVGVDKLHFMVDDLNATVGRLAAEGVGLVRPITPTRRQALVSDPDGRPVLVGERSAFVSRFDDLDADHRRGGRGDGAPTVDITEPAVRRGLGFERIAAAVIAVGTLFVAFTSAVLFVRIASGSDRDFLLLQMKPAQAPYYGIAWAATLGTVVIVAGRGLQLAGGDLFAKLGYVILAMVMDGVATAIGLKTLLTGSDSPFFMASAMVALALGGIVGSSRLQEAAANLRRPPLSFWTKAATGTSCAMLVLPLVVFGVARALPIPPAIATAVIQVTFLAGLFMQFCLHVVYCRFVHQAITDPQSLS
jgi:hypothetical protein